MMRPVSNATRRMVQFVGWERILLLGLLIITFFLGFYNLKYSPRPWHDEGAALSVSKTLVEDGVYAVRSSEGYQTFGPIQSVGPTVLVPVALSFKLFGVGLVQGRIVAVGYLLLTILVLYLLGRELFGWPVALMALMLLLGSQSARFLYHGRQVLGEVPAFGFFVVGWLVWFRSMQSKSLWPSIVFGLLLGASIITKNSYMIIIFGTISLLIVLDLVYYKQGKTTALALAGFVALACVLGWLGWQIIYFGIDTFQTNLDNLGQLTSSTTSLSLGTSVAALQSLTGSDWGHFYFWWGLPALLYGGFLSIQRNQRGFALAGLSIFAILWLVYFLIWGVSWLAYTFVPAAISTLFVSKLWSDLTEGFTVSWQSFRNELRLGKPGQAALRIAVLSLFGLVMCYQLQGILRQDVLARDQAPQQLALYLQETVDKNTVIETWERELAVLTDHPYHYPDQVLLARTHAFIYRGGPLDYALGTDYFQANPSPYLVSGWFARWTNIYDAEFLEDNGELVATFGNGESRYDVYRLHQAPSVELAP